MSISQVILAVKSWMRSYRAFKFLVILFLDFYLIVSLFTIGLTQIRGIRTTDGILLCMLYVFTYWLSHLGFAASQILLTFLLFPVDLLEVLFRSFFKTLPVRATRRVSDIRLAKASSMLLVILVGAVLLNVPLLHLRSGTWYLFLGYSIVPVMVGVAYIIIYGGDLHLWKPRHALANHQFNFKSFDCASLGVLSHEALEELRIYSEGIARRNPTEKWEYVCWGDPARQAYWRGHVEFFRTLSVFSGVKAEEIRLFHTTTEAIAHAVREAAHNIPSNTKNRTILTTDAEYETVAGLLDGFAKSKAGSVERVQIEQDVMDGRLAFDIASRVVKAFEDLGNSVSIICMAHVLPGSGFVMPLAEIFDGLAACCKRKRRKMPFIIIDGAQAMGQMHVPPALIARVHYYATSGHKWLLGKETLGILFTNREVLDTRIAKNLPITTSLSRYMRVEEIRSERAATVNPESRLTLNASLNDILNTDPIKIEEHNRALTEIFHSHLASVRSVRVIRISSFVGMTLVEVDNPERVLVELPQSKFGIGIYRVSQSNQKYLRICFHYYHSEGDVNDLVNALIAATDH